MNRRSNKVSGFVNFPINSKDYKNTNEGGMTVELRVLLTDKDNWSQCCGVGNIYSIMGESFLNKINKHYPNYENRNLNQKDEYLGSIKPYLSIGYFSVITLGSTGWSGWSNKKKNYFKCKHEDLNKDGKDLFNLIKKLYGKSAELELCTILDT
jgi:hypothetical protein